MASKADYAMLLGGAAILTGISLNYEPIRNTIDSIAAAILQNPDVVDMAAKGADYGIIFGGAVGLAGLLGKLVAPKGKKQPDDPDSPY